MPVQQTWSASVWAVENTTPAKYENVKVWAADTWHPTVDGKIRNLEIISINYNTFRESWPLALTKNKQITELPYIGKEYSVSFEVFINKMPTQPYQGVLHFTTGENYAAMGSRNPAVWVTASKEFHIASAVSGNKNLVKNFPGLEENKWYKIEINQKLVDAKVINLNLEFRLIKHILVHV